MLEPVDWSIKMLWRQAMIARRRRRSRWPARSHRWRVLAGERGRQLTPRTEPFIRLSCYLVHAPVATAATREDDYVELQGIPPFVATNPTSLLDPPDDKSSGTETDFSDASRC